MGHTVQSAVFVRSALVDKRIIDIARFQTIQEVQEEDSILVIRILEASHRRTLSTLLNSFIGPFDNV